MKILNKEEINKNLMGINLIALQEEGFIAYSQGNFIATPVGHLDISDCNGECHIKSGYIRGDSVFVVKTATTFYENQKKGLPSGNGMMVLWNRKTGAPEALLQDQGYLTDLRTALAGAIVAKYMAPKKVHRIGIVGTGVQARLQLLHLKNQVDCRDVLVWGRSQEKLNRYLERLRDTDGNTDFKIQTTTRIEDITGTCNLIVTTTASRQPLIMASQVLLGTHITAVGADGPGKQELDPAVFSKADLRVVDSIEQCSLLGEAHYALAAKLIQRQDLVELGKVIADSSLHRRSDHLITVADLTGLAVQDVQIAKAALGTEVP